CSSALVGAAPGEAALPGPLQDREDDVFGDVIGRREPGQKADGCVDPPAGAEAQAAADEVRRLAQRLGQQAAVFVHVLREACAPGPAAMNGLDSSGACGGPQQDRSCAGSLRRRLPEYAPGWAAVSYPRSGLGLGQPCGPISVSASSSVGSRTGPTDLPSNWFGCRNAGRAERISGTG